MVGSRIALQPLRFLGAPTRSAFRATSRPSSRYASSTAHVNTTNAPSQSSKWLRRLVYAGIFGGLGMFAGTRVDEKLAIPLVPGTKQDTNALERLQLVFDKATPIVMELRNNPDYEESDVYGNYSEDEKSSRLTSGPLRGTRGLALQVWFLFQPTHSLADLIGLLSCKMVSMPPPKSIPDHTYPYEMPPILTKNVYYTESLLERERKGSHQCGLPRSRTRRMADNDPRRCHCNRAR